MPAKKAKRAPRSDRARNPGRGRGSRRSRWPIALGPALAGVICIVGGAALIVAIADAPTGTHAPLQSQTRPEQPRLASTPRADVNVDARKALVPKAAPRVESLKAPGGAATEPAAEASSKAASAESTPNAAAENVTSASVTITGCLEQDDETFWLKDTGGADAPASRSWKSGFLKKRPSRIEIVDAGTGLKLPNYIGQRIAATGTLVNREMQTRSLHRVASTCS